MNKKFKKMAFRGIRGSLSRFLSIVCIVALGSGFLAGLLATTPDMKKTVNNYFVNNNFYDFYVQSSLGFSKKDVKAFENEKYVDKVLAIEQEDIIVKDKDGESLETRIFHVDLDDEDRINNIEIIKGRKPTKADECILEVPNQYSYTPKLNSVFTTEDGKKYTAVGIGKSPMFLSSSGEATTIGKGTIALGIYVDQKEKPDVYTAIYGLGKIKNKDTFSSEYKKELKKIEYNIEKFEKTQAIKRQEEIKKEAQKKLDKEKSKFKKEKKKAIAKLSKSYNDLNLNKIKLNNGLKKIKDGQRQIEDGFKQIDINKNKIAKEEEKLKKLTYTVNANITKVKNGLSEVDKGIAVVSEKLNKLYQLPPEVQIVVKDKIVALETEKKKLTATKTKLQENLKELNQAKKQIKSGLEQIETSKNTLAVSKKKLESKRSQLIVQKNKLLENKVKLEDGFKKYEEAKLRAYSSFDKAEAKINKAQKKIDDIKKPEWYINTRLDANGVNSFKNDVDKVGAIAKVFPVFFFAVASLVVLTTMTRMIEEERMQVGTLKSLGYSNGIIQSYYLIYGLIATFIGSAIGLSIGFQVFPTVISNAYSMMYNMPPVETRFIVEIALVIEVVTVICITLTIWLAVRKELKEKPAQLMQPKAPEAGKRIILEKITPIWSRLKFTHKVTLRNLFRYKKRFLMTIIGVAGCFALLLTGFGLRDSISDIANLQYGEIYKYDMTISVEDGKWKKDTKNFLKEGEFLNDKLDVVNGNKTENAALHVAEDDKTLKGFINLRTRNGHDKIELTNDGVVLSEKMAEVLGVKKGDTVELDSDKFGSHNVKVIGVCENYVQNNIYMTKELYEETFNEKYQFNTVFTQLKKSLNEKERSKLIVDVMEREGVSYALATDTIMENFNDSIKNIDYIVLVLIFSAGGLSMIVLYNLTNINICERKRELATIKVLGFYEKEVRSYIFREIDILTLIGTLIGIPIGIAFHNFVIKTAEVGGVMFGRNIYPLSYVLSIAITMLFAFLVNIIMKRSIKKIDMVESMKANE